MEVHDSIIWLEMPDNYATIEEQLKRYRSDVDDAVTFIRLMLERPGEALRSAVITAVIVAMAELQSETPDLVRNQVEMIQAAEHLRVQHSNLKAYEWSHLLHSACNVHSDRADVVLVHVLALQMALRKEGHYDIIWDEIMSSKFPKNKNFVEAFEASMEHMGILGVSLAVGRVAANEMKL